MRVIPLGFVTAALAGTAAAQFDELSQLRDEHARAVSAATRMLDDVYRLTLRRIEKELAERGDYQGAQRARDRSEAFAAKSVPAAVKPAGMQLPASQARTQGAAYDRGRDVLEFRKTGATAIWELLRIVPGPYEVEAVYSVGTPQGKGRSGSAELSPCGGKFAWKIETNLGESAPALEREVRTTGSWDNFVRRTIGKCEFKSRSATVRIDAVSAQPGGLMNLRHIELKPVLRENGPGERADPLAELRQRNWEALNSVTASVQQKFQAEFEKLERELTQRGDNGAAAAVAAERARLFRESETRTTTPP